MLDSFTTTYCAILAYAAITALLAFGSKRWPASAAVGGRSVVQMRSALRRAVPVFFLLASGAVLLFGRRMVLRFDRIFNPDEALFSAAAMLTRHGWLNWDIVDTTSSGPLNAAFLAWPYLFGGDITLFSTRLFGLAALRPDSTRSRHIATSPGRAPINPFRDRNRLQLKLAGRSQ